MFFKKYVSSRYNNLVESPDGNGTILFNQISGAMIVLDDENLKQYNEIISGKAKHKSLRNYLIEKKFLISSEHDELDFIGKQWKKVTTDTLNKCLTIVPTDRCNLGCHYCYEEKRSWVIMSDETQEKLKKFADVYVNSTPTERLSVIWFGGEATLHMKAVENLSKHFIALCKEKGIVYDPFMVTNGTTLTDYMIERLERCEIKSLQITVDGLQEDHDLSRPYLRDLKLEQMNPAQVEQRKKIEPNFGLLPVINQNPPKPKSSFNEIMTAIRKIHKKGFKVKLRANVSFVNKESVKKLFFQLKEEGLLTRDASGGIVLAYSHPIFDGCGGSTLDSMSKKQHADYEEELMKEIPEVVIWKEGRMGFTGETCTANKDFQFVINQNGLIVKCWHHATDDKFIIGNIDNLDLARYGTSSVDQLKFDPLEDDECRTCSVLPLCMGGCKANNQFPEKGYKGSHDVGCSTARYSLNEKIVRLYLKSKT